MDDTKVTITFDLDQFDIDDFDSGQMEDIQEGKYKGIRQLIEGYAVVEGLPKGMTLTAYLRSLKPSEMIGLAVDLTSLINERQNPVRNGKNSNGVSPNTSLTKRVRRR